MTLTAGSESATTDPAHRSALPLVVDDASRLRHGSRDRMTCFWRCGNACDKAEPNTTDHEHVRDVISRAAARRVGRRSVLRAGAVGGGALAASAAAGGSLAAAATGPTVAARASLATTSFRSVPPNRRDAVVTPDGFTSDVVIRWGDPVVEGAPEFDPRGLTIEAARSQFGFNCDYVGVLPLGRDSALLVVNHEYTTPTAMYPAGVYSPTEMLAVDMSYHGMSVVRIKKGAVAGSWRRVTNLSKCRENRRLHIETPFRFTGVAAGDELLQTSADPAGRTPLGTLNNCSGGMTPWGTVLSGEENFNQYFDTSGSLDPRYTAEYARYGITATGGGTEGRNWKSVDPRFDLAAEPHEPHRFGWIVEVDPYDPASTPRKHTMLGRFKHEGANIVIAKNGRAVAYMGDDERGDYLYKFVSSGTFDERDTPAAKRRNMRLLTAGTLYVAKLTDDTPADEAPEYDGVGEWIPLCDENESFVDGMTQAEVLVFTRLAADKVAPTKMDRPEDVEPNLVTGKVYAALTNNSDRGVKYGVDEANPVGSSETRANPVAPLTTATGNRNGYVLEMTPDNGNHAKTTFTWSLFLVCGDPESAYTYFGGFDKDQVSRISCPDNVAFDSKGNLWVSTDGNALGANDGIFRVPTEGPERGYVQQFVSMPKGAEACGPLLVDGDRSLFFAVQHPGEITGSTFDNPASTWPHTDDFPRPSVGVAFRRG